MMKKLGLAIVVGSALSGPMPLMADEPVTPLIAQACAGCHGQSGEGLGAVPRIAGKDRAVFIATWEAFRAGEKPATIMNRIAPGYTESEVAALADYFSALRAEP